MTGIETQKQETVTSFFGAHPARYFETYGSTTPDGHSFQTREARLLELLGKGTGRVLDIGCGPAVTAPGIIQKGWVYEGMDIAEGMIEEAKKRLPQATFHVSSVEHIPAKENTYNAVIAMGLVEYVEDDRTAIREIARTLKPGGRAFISLPNWYSPLRMWDRWLIAPIGKMLNVFFKRPRRGIFHREYKLGEYKKLLREANLLPTRAAFHNIRLFPRPFDQWFPNASVFVSQKMEWLAKTPLRFLATSMIIEAEKQ